MTWKKVDSHVETRTFRHGQKPKGDKYAFRLNKVADKMAGDVRKLMTASPVEVFFP